MHRTNLNRVNEGYRLMNLDGPKRKALRNALMSAFPGWSDLRQMTSDYLDIQLARLVPENSDLETQTFELVQWAESRGKLADLVVGARYANPDNLDLFAFAQKIGINSTNQGSSTLEKFVSNNTTFLDVSVWTGRLSKIEWCMCRVDIDGKGAGTGFLVGPDVVLTNYHVVNKVINGSIAPTRVSCLFDFKYGEDQVLSEGNRFSLVEGERWTLGFSPFSKHDTEPDPKSGEPGANELDFALLRLAQPVGKLTAGGYQNGQERNWITVSRNPVDFSTLKGIAILQHPNRDPLKLALGMAEQIKLNAAGNRIRYSVPTLPGSSGSPVFDTDWELVALHHSGDPDSIKPEYNEGIPISVIANHPAVSSYLIELDGLR